MSYRDIPIVSLDKIYLEIDNQSIIFLDCTRLNNSKDLVSRTNPEDNESVERQVKQISELLLSIGSTNIILADDVVFSGSVLKTIIEKFKNYKVQVIGIRTCISSYEGYEYFNKTLPLGLKTKILMSKDIIDQICERDFYFGIVGSGISIKKENEILKAPYFLPFGNPVERASIPQEYAKYFSYSCVKRSILLWEEIERLSKRKILIGELPERINNTNQNEEIIKTLRKELK
mgnify:CR=1 FL=1